MPPVRKITVYTNDGTEILGSVTLIEAGEDGHNVYVYDNGIGATGTPTAGYGYIYDGPGKWLGVSMTPNATSPEYGPGTYFSVPINSNVYAVIKNTVSIDLSTLSGYSSIISGTHNIAVKAKATGYMDSDLSASVPYIGPMPAKGDILTIESKQYRILKINGNIAELLSLYDTGTKVQFDSSNTGTYAGNGVDTYCNDTFYNSLSSTMKAAIIDKTFNQDSWSSSTSGSSVYIGKYTKDSATHTYNISLSSAAFGPSITRHCYCISIQDIIDYLEVTTSMTDSNTTLTDTNIRTMLWNNVNYSSSILWLSSAYSGMSGSVYMVPGNYGNLNFTFSMMSQIVRPAFQIDLSKIEYTR